MGCNLAFRIYYFVVRGGGGGALLKSGTNILRSFSPLYINNSLSNILVIAKHYLWHHLLSHYPFSTNSGLCLKR